jgi:hypothetical protein
MAFTPNEFLRNDTNVTLRDQQHAARVFTDDQFRLAPKHKFLFHVAFGINPAALTNINLVQRHRNEINLLVKSCDLPNFSVTVETLNQYNRKKNVQTTHKYNPINILFHDDNMGIINQLWQSYYSYYYADSLAATDPGAYKRNATKSSDYINNTFGLDNGSTLPFFNYIKIYQMARHEYVSYTLSNPIIQSWNHNKVNYEESKGHDNTMQIMYESVAYGSGQVTENDPEGFGVEHYDRTPSPLQGSSDAQSSSPSFAPSNATNNAKEYLNTVVSQITSYQNPQTSGNTNGTSSVLSSIVQTANTGLGGLQGFQFPTVQNQTNNVVIAKQVNIGSLVVNVTR